MTTRRGFPTARTYAPTLAPMVDVVMVILVFFMLRTSIDVVEGVLPTELPSQIGPGGGADVTVVPAIRIVLQETSGGSCRIIVMNQELPENSFEGLRTLLKQRLAAGADPNGRVLIGAEPSVEYQNVISAMDACVRAGFSNIQFSVSPDMNPSLG